MNHPIHINKIQVFIGLLTLFLGSAIYLIRSPCSVYFVPKYFSYIGFPNDILNVVKIVGNNLPDFIHPFAFILITAGLISLDNRINQFFICIGWFLLESFFELGQHFKEAYLRIVPSWFDSVPILENTKNYFLYGTFDILDMLSIITGAVTAFIVLLITSKRRNEE